MGRKSVANAKNPRGRPKQPWDPYAAELDHRLKVGIAKETVEAESKALEKWAKDNKDLFPGGVPLQFEAIRNRINKRFGKAQGYKNARAHHLSQIKSGKIPI